MSHDPGSTQTDWSMIVRAICEEDARSAEALETLARRYWLSVYAFIRSTGRDVAEACDLTQGFFADVIMGQRLLHAADPERGRFRNLLVKSVENYLRQADRDQRRLRRAPGGRPEAILNTPGLDGAAIEAGDTPQAAFDRQWSITLIMQVVERVRRECEGEDMAEHWRIFEGRVIRPALLGEPLTPYADLVERLHLRDEAQAANMMITVKRRFARSLREHVRHTVQLADEAEDELLHLLQALERPT